MRRRKPRDITRGKDTKIVRPVPTETLEMLYKEAQRLGITADVLQTRRAEARKKELGYESKKTGRDSDEGIELGD